MRLTMECARDNRGRFLTVRTVAAPAAQVGSLRGTPVARSMALKWSRGSLVRSWPSALLVSTEGRTTRVRIVDVTRLAQVAIVLAAMLCTCGFLTGASSRKERSP
jgi:hypothetical protein